MKCLKYKGYYIKKSDLTNEQLAKIKKDLKVKPKLLEFGKQENNDTSFK